MLDRPKHRSYEHAAKGYEVEFEPHLVDAVTNVIADESRVEDVPAMVLRMGGPSPRPPTCLASMLALPDMGVRSRLRETVEQLAKRIRRDAARANAEGLGDRLGAGKWTGHA